MAAGPSDHLCSTSKLCLHTNPPLHLYLRIWVLLPNTGFHVRFQKQEASSRLTRVTGRRRWLHREH